MLLGKDIGTSFSPMNIDTLYFLAFFLSFFLSFFLFLSSSKKMTRALSFEPTRRKEVRIFKCVCVCRHALVFLSHSHQKICRRDRLTHSLGLIITFPSGLLIAKENEARQDKDKYKLL